METPIKINVEESDISFAKKQIEDFEKSEYGKFRYDGVEAWRGVVCEMLTSKWLESHFNVVKKAKGIDTSGNCDECDLLIGNKKVEIKSATCNHYRLIMPKIHDIISLPKDIYIGVRYNQTVQPNQIEIIGYLPLDAIKKYPQRQNKGAPYYEMPQKDFIPITYKTFD